MCKKTVAQIFNERHPQENVNYTYALNLLKKFMETELMDNKKHGRWKRPIRNATIEVAVLGHLQWTILKVLSCFKII